LMTQANPKHRDNRTTAKTVNLPLV
jgi:hypothetical protein